MNWLHSRIFKAVSIIVLAFFTWTSGGLFDIAYAISNSSESGVKSSELKTEKPEEKLQKTLDEIEGILSDTSTDTNTKKTKIKPKKSEIATIDVEIKKQFKETEDKIKDLPDEILQRHKDFVKHYDDNLKELNTNLDAIDKAKTEAEINAEIEKTKAFLEKVKPPKKHTPLDPNNLPHRTAEPEWIEPRTSPEQFEKDGGQGLAVRGQERQKPILVASASDSLAGLLNSTNPTNSQRSDSINSLDSQRSDSINSLDSQLSDSINSLNSKLSTPNLLLALATPPSLADLSETIEVQFTPEITAKAEELQHNPVKIYNWVRNNIEFVPTYGSIQGANMCLQTKQCNAFDTSSLLIALLRVSGIHAKYVQGTVEIPIEKVKNWVGGFTDSMSALNLLASAGIPTAGQVVGGEIKHVRIEHTWVESYIDYIPSRGAKHKTGDTWIPLDSSFKQYNYTQGIDIKSEVPFDAQSFVNQIQSTATINEAEGYVTNVNSSFISQTMTDYQTQVQNYITQTYPNATVGDVLGKKEIVKQEFPHLLGTLPYKTIVAGAKYTSIPNSLRHKITFNVTKDIYDSGLGTPINITKTLPEIAGKKITLSYSPATASDEAVINKYLPKPHTDGTPIQASEFPTSFPAYLINLKPELRIDGVVVTTGSSVGMGNTESFKMTFTGPRVNTGVVTNEIVAGEYLGLSIDIGEIPRDQITALKTKLESTKAKLAAANFAGLTQDDIFGDMLYLTATLYNARIDGYDIVLAHSLGVRAVRAPSETIFQTILGVKYLFGAPLSAFDNGLMMDADRNISFVKAFDGNNKKNVQFMYFSGINGSALEHRVPEQLFSTLENPEYGISAVKALQLANDQGIPIYTINKTNVSTVLPQLQIDYDDKTDIKNAVNAGKEVIVSKTNINYQGWIGCGYVITDTITGSGAYRISGGTSGGFMLLPIGFPPLLWSYILLPSTTWEEAKLAITKFVGFEITEPEDWCGSKGSERVPDYPFGIDAREACKNHDNCYKSAPLPSDKVICDVGLYANLTFDCIEQGSDIVLCGMVGSTYTYGVLIFGWGAWRKS